MRVDRLGDRAYILRDLDGPAHEVAASLSSLEIPGLIEANAAYDTVGVYVGANFDAGHFESYRTNGTNKTFESYTIPVLFDGEDLPSAAQALGLPQEQVIAEFCGSCYTVRAIGFCPGFPYLSGLPDALTGLPRLPSPRARVPSGSVAITGAQAGIYPMEVPGGWNLLGRTPLCMVSVVEGYFPLSAGDEVRFVSIGEREFQEREGERL